jgi:hypothetical protein
MRISGAMCVYVVAVVVMVVVGGATLLGADGSVRRSVRVHALSARRLCPHRATPLMKRALGPCGWAGHAHSFSFLPRAFRKPTVCLLIASSSSAFSAS